MTYKTQITADMNLNAADCIKTARGFFENVFTNVCSGEAVIVQNGIIDMLEYSAVAALIISFISIVAFFIAFMAHEVF